MRHNLLFAHQLTSLARCVFTCWFSPQPQSSSSSPRLSSDWSLALMTELSYAASANQRRSRQWRRRHRRGGVVTSRQQSTATYRWMSCWLLTIIIKTPIWVNITYLENMARIRKSAVTLFWAKQQYERRFHIEWLWEKWHAMWKLLKYSAYNVQRARLLKRRRSNVNFSASRVIVLPEYRFTLAVCVAFWE